MELDPAFANKTQQEKLTKSLNILTKNILFQFIDFIV